MPQTDRITIARPGLLAFAGARSVQLTLFARAATGIDPLSFIAAMNPPLSDRMPKYDSNAVADAGRVYDGIFHIDRMPAVTKPH